MGTDNKLDHISRSLWSVNLLFLEPLVVCTVELFILTTCGRKQIIMFCCILIIKIVLLLCLFFFFYRHKIETQLSTRNLKGDVDFSHLEDRDAMVLFP